MINAKGHNNVKTSFLKGRKCRLLSICPVNQSTEYMRRFLVQLIIYKESPAARLDE